jgi:Xaa-Pro aminopeptidase
MRSACAWDLADALARKLFVEKPSPVAAAKAVKNEAELAGMREAHLRDAVALAETFHHLEQEVRPPAIPCHAHFDFVPLPWL